MYWLPSFVEYHEGRTENTARANDYSFRSVRGRPSWPHANAVFLSELYHSSSPEVKKIKRGGVSGPLDLCVCGLYTCIYCNTCGFGKRALLSDSPFRSLCCSSFFFVSPRQPDNKTSRRTNMPLVGKPQRACSCVMLMCGAYHMTG